MLMFTICYALSERIQAHNIFWSDTYNLKIQKIMKQKVGSSCNEKYKLSKKCPTIGVPN